MNNIPTFNTTTNPNPYIGNHYASPTVPSFNYPASTLRSILPGRSVESSKDILPGEVPMDGGISVFPRSDGSAIYVKYRNGKGLIEDHIFVPAPEDYNEEILDVDQETMNIKDILNTVNDLSTKVDALSDIIASNASSNSRKYNNKSNKNHNQQNPKEGAEVNA